MVVKRVMLVYLARWDWMLVSILTFNIWQTTPAGYVPERKRPRESQKRLDTLKGYKKKTIRTITNWWRGLPIVRGLGLTTFSKYN